MAFPTDWGRKCALVIQSSEIGTTESNFPVFLTKDTLPTEMFAVAGEYEALEGGGDIRFSSDEAGSSQLACEIVTFSLDDADDEAEIYVNVASIAHDADTTIYVWYNKSGESQPAEGEAYGKHATWNSNYKAVWHFNEDSGVRYDATQNDNDLADSGTVPSATGKVGQKCADFIQANSDYLAITDASQTGLEFDGDYTITFWINLDSVYGNQGIIDKKESHQEEFFYCAWMYESAPSTYRLEIVHEHDWGGENEWSSWSEQDISAETWYFFSTQHDDSEDSLVFGKNDSFDSADTITLVSTGNTTDVNIGRASSTDYLGGMLDEIRVSDIPRGNGWVATEYNNLNDPATFVIEGTPESTVTDLTIDVSECE